MKRDALKRKKEKMRKVTINEERGAGNVQMRSRHVSIVKLVKLCFSYSNDSKD